jgi:hypothetical protein
MMLIQAKLAFVATALAVAAQDTGRAGAASADPGDQVESTSVVALPDGVDRPAVSETRAVDLAICLDTSGSMNGLIEAAKQKLWSIVNDLALAEPEPVLRVALLTYGNDGHDPEAGWVRVDVPLTTDIDLISKHLFALSTNGGTELVGRVVDRATAGLEWSPDPMALKLIVVAGNESADQDQVIPFGVACKNAITAGVMINSIYCGDQADPIASGWRQVAALADGHFASIDHDTGTVVVATPFDEQLNALSVAVNHTYIPLGSVGREGWTNQVVQDENASGLNGAAGAARAQTKGSRLYSKAWDLVDLEGREGFDWSAIKAEDLPECMRGMDLAARKAYVAKLREERSGIHVQIAELAEQRALWVTAYKKLNNLDESKAFDNALRGALRAQAASKGFRFQGEDLREPTTEELEAIMRQLEEQQEDSAQVPERPEGEPQAPGVPDAPQRQIQQRGQGTQKKEGPSEVLPVQQQGAGPGHGQW